MPDILDALDAAIGKKYKILRELTGGGMSRVFLAHEQALQRDVVVKLLATDQFDPARAERFRLEVLQTARLQHPTIIPVLEVGSIETDPAHPLPYYVMPYARGESLRSRLHHEGHLSIGLTMRVLRSVFDALSHAHAHGVIHRDIKPENIFLSGTNALLADFGIAKAITGPGSRSSVTSPGMAMGTPAYMSPEQLIDGDRVGPSSDLYAVGIVAFEMLTGRLPWDSLTPVESLAAQASGRAVGLRTQRPDVPPDMATVIEACLSWDQTQRPESAAKALVALEAIPVQRTPDTSGSNAALSDTAEASRSFAATPNKTPSTASTATPTTTPTTTPPTAARTARRARPAMWIALAMVVLLGVAQLVRTKFAGTPAAETERELAVLYPELPTDAVGRDEVAARLYQMFTNTLAPVSGLRLVGQVSVPRLATLGLGSAQIADSLKLEGVDSVLTLKASNAGGGALTLAVEVRGLKSGDGETVAGPIAVNAIAGLSLDSLRVIVRLLAAQSVAKLHLGSANRAASETQRIDAYMSWLNGRDALAKRSPEGLRNATEHFARAIVLDTAYAQAHADYSQALSLSLFYHYRLPESSYEVAAHALSLADRAVKLKPEFADGYLARALLGTVAGAPTRYVQANFDSVGLFQSANPYSRTFLLGLLAKLGKFDEAVQRAEEEVRLDPRSPGQRIASAMYSLPAGQYVTALRNATAARSVLQDVPLLAQLELIGRLRLGGRALAECVPIPAGPFLGARALCLERNGRAQDGHVVADSLFAILTGKAAMDSTFDLALFLGEMAMYSTQQADRDGARQWLRQAYIESPAGVDFRIMRSGMFTTADIQLADSMQVIGWTRVARDGAAWVGSQARPDKSP